MRVAMYRVCRASARPAGHVLAGVAVQRRHDHQRRDATPVELAEFGQFGQQHDNAGWANAGHVGQRLRQLGVMVLNVRSHLGFAVSQLLLQELDHALDARVTCLV
ncbi:hypothetical protein APR51_21125 [Variovorax paradoxus]|nr:hypothetical protein APR52_34550 [Variovorax paradoxus]KPV19222.1 hypothetical protein APR51_21125 [Variovorax paradoxus]